MKKFLLTLLVVIVALGALAGIGFAGYRYGYANGASASGKAPAVIPFRHMDPDQMPMYRFRDNAGPWGGQGFYPMMGGYGHMGFGFFSPLHFIWNIAVLGLIVWFIYWLFTKSGWRLTRTTDQGSSTKTEG